MPLKAVRDCAVRPISKMLDLSRVALLVSAVGHSATGGVAKRAKGELDSYETRVTYHGFDKGFRTIKNGIHKVYLAGL